MKKFITGGKTTVSAALTLKSVPAGTKNGKEVSYCMSWFMVDHRITKEFDRLMSDPFEGRNIFSLPVDPRPI
jgi:hypothetical protein